MDHVIFDITLGMFTKKTINASFFLCQCVLAFIILQSLKQVLLETQIYCQGSETDKASRSPRKQTMIAITTVVNDRSFALIICVCQRFQLMHAFTRMISLALKAVCFSRF